MAVETGPRQVEIFQEEGVDPARVVIGHADSYPSLDYYLAIVGRGDGRQGDEEADPHERRWARFSSHLTGDFLFMGRFLILGAAIAAAVGREPAPTRAR